MSGARMAAEMAEQPAVLSRLAARRDEIRALVRGVAPRPLTGIVLVARGSSDHAAASARYLLAAACQRPVSLGSPSLLTHYGATIDLRGYLVIAISQSGRTPEIIRYVERARGAGAATLAVTNAGDSPLASTADAAVALAAGPERAVPATKTVTAQLVALALIARALGPVRFSDSEAEALPAAVGELLSDAGPAERVAAALAETPQVLTVARGILHGAALELALKLQETTGRLVTGFAAADLRHGPIAVVRPGVGVLALSAPGPTHADMRDLCDLLAERGARVFLAAPERSADLPWPARVPEALSPVAAVVRGQQVALALTRQLGLDPDEPAGLTKVTIT